MSGDAPLERELLEQVAEVTLPTAREMAAVIQGTAAPAPKARSWLWWMVPGIGAVVGFGALVAVVALVAWSTRFGPLDVAVGDSRWVGPASTLRIGPGLRVTGSAKIAVEEARVGGVRVAVQRGTAWFAQASGPPVVVRLGEADIELGTARIEVSRNDRGGVVRVLDGVVRWKRGDRSESLKTGEWRSFAAESAPGVWAPVLSPPAPALSPPPETLAEVPPEVAVAEPVPEPAPAPRPKPAPASPAPAPRPKPSPAPPQKPSPKPAPSWAALDGASGSESADWTAVLDQMDRGAAPVDVIARLDGFLARHPKGAFRAEAEYWRLQQRSLVLPPAEAAAEMEAFFERSPEAPRALDVRFLHARLSREGLRDCARALPSFREVAGYDKVGRAGQALAGQGLCAASVGRGVEARWALERALERELPAALREEVTVALEALGADPR